MKSTLAIIWENDMALKRNPLIMLFVAIAVFVVMAQPVYSNDVLSREERIRGLLTIYQGAKQHFAWSEQVPELDWDKTFIEYLPLVEEKQKLYDYYRVLQSFTALLSDGHTNVHLPSVIQKELDALPIKMEMIEKQWVVTRRYPVHEILGEDIPPGTTVLSIEDAEPLQYFQEKLFPYISGGSMAQKQNAINGSLFLSNTTVSFQVKYPDGRLCDREIKANRGTVQWTETLRQKYCPNCVISSKYESRQLPGKLLYVRYPRCENAYDNKFIELLECLRDDWPNALVTDMRGNPGGNTPQKLLGYFIPVPIKAGIRRTRCSISDLDSQLQAVLERNGLTPSVKTAIERAIKAGQLPKGYSPGWITSENTVGPNPIHYDGPLYLIVNSETASAAEDMAAILKECSRATIVGTPTCGSTGNSITFKLPGGGNVRICVSQAKYADSTGFVPMGVQPDVVLQLTIKGIIDGHDEILESTLQFARSASENPVVGPRASVDWQGR